MKKNMYYEQINGMIDNVLTSEDLNMTKAAELIANAIESGGILHAFGSGHSYANAIEICGRAGGLIPSKAVEEPSRGIYEMIEGVGTQFTNFVDFKENDVIVMISNSGRNPLSIEIAMYAQLIGMKIIVLTALDSSKQLTSRHSSGKLLYQFGDVIIDNHGVPGDAAITLPGLEVKTGGTSSVIGSILLNEVMLRSIQLMIENGYTPPIFLSANIDGGPSYNQTQLDKYKDRLI